MKSMALWCRLKQPQLRNLSIHLKRCYFSSILLTQHPRITTITHQDSIWSNTHFKIPQNFRSYAVPAQFKPKTEEELEEEEGPRLNEKIKTPFIRLVLDEGHMVVPLREALDRAKSLHQDLVEVDRKAKPPVCKIMDYHKEQYVKQLKEKERSKSKAEVTLKSGTSKSVHFEGKIEEKDLQMKAATVKKMMESGYRVKCLAKATDKKAKANDNTEENDNAENDKKAKGKKVKNKKVNDKKAVAYEDENLPGLLARFCALIKDVAVIESGPIMEKKGAYVVVRHVKYGLPKKGSKNTSQLQAKSNQAKQVSHSEADTIPLNESRSSPQTEMNVASPPRETENRYQNHPRSRSPPSAEINVASPSLETENRYKKDLRNRYSPTETNSTSADPRRLQPQSPYQGRQPQQYPNQDRQAQQYPNQGRQAQQYPNQGRQTQQYPDQGRPTQQYPYQGRPTQPYPNQGGQAQQYPNQGRPYPGASPNSSGGPEPNNTTEPQPTVVNRYKKALNQNSSVFNLHGSRGQGR